MPRDEDHIIEYITIGGSMKVTAFDPKTLKEASVIVPPGTPRHEAASLAIRKLDYVLGKPQGNE